MTPSSYDVCPNCRRRVAVVGIARPTFVPHSDGHGHPCVPNPKDDQ